MAAVQVRSVLGVAAVALALAACGSSGGGGGSSASGTPTSGGSTHPTAGQVNVYAAASLTEAFDTLKPQFEKAHPGSTVTITYGASSDLATQIQQGAPVDVFASASTTNMDTVVSGGDAKNPVVFASNVAEIAIPPSNPGKVMSVRDLADKGVKVAVCAPAVPCGVIAAKVFKNAKITVKPVASEKDVKSTLAVVQTGEVDAGVVYVTDVRAAGDKVKGVPIPASVNASTDYPIALTTRGTKNVLAKDWEQFVLSSTGRKVLTADGFRRP